MTLSLTQSNSYLTRDFNFTQKVDEISIVSKEILYTFGSYEIIYLKIDGKYLEKEAKCLRLVDSPTKNSAILWDGYNYHTTNNGFLDIDRFTGKLSSNSHDFPSEIINCIQINPFKPELIIANLTEESLKVLDNLSDIVHSSQHSRISNPEDIDKEFSVILHDKIIHQILKEYYKEEKYHCTTYSTNTLRNDDESEPYFHCDYPYHDLSEEQFLEYKNKLLGVQIIITLDPFTEENGATHYIDGSQLYGKNPNREDIERCYNEGKFKRVVCDKYKIIAYPATLWHSQGINFTDKDRSALLLNFSPIWVEKKKY